MILKPYTSALVILLVIFTFGCTNIPENTNQPPVVNAGEDIFVSVGEEFNFAGSANDPDGKIVSYEWDANGDGEYDTFCKFCATDAYKFEKAGTYTATLKVIDDSGAESTDSITIIVS